MFAEDGQAFADVGEVGVGVELVRVAQDRGRLVVEGGGDDPVAQHGLGAAAGAEVVRGPTGGHLHIAGRMRRLELAGHPGAQRAFLGVGGIGAGLGQGLAVGAAVHVDVFHADQPGPGGLGGGQHAGLEGGEQLDPLGVGRIQGLVDDLGAGGGGGGEGGVAGVAAQDLDVVGDRGGAGAVDQPHPLTAAAQGVQGRETDGAGPEDHMLWGSVHAQSTPRWLV
jgi:hypothetical protein